MDDRWFMFFEDGWLYLHRSWTGACIFGVRLASTPEGEEVAEAWASRDQDQYRSDDVAEDVETVQGLLTHMLASGHC